VPSPPLPITCDDELDRREVLAETIVNAACLMQSALRRYRLAARTWPPRTRELEPL